MYLVQTLNFSCNHEVADIKIKVVTEALSRLPKIFPVDLEKGYLNLCVSRRYSVAFMLLIVMTIHALAVKRVSFFFYTTFVITYCPW